MAVFLDHLALHNASGIVNQADRTLTIMIGGWL